MPSTPPAATTKYNIVAMSLHWLIAALIVTNIGIAWYFNTLNGVVKIPPIQLHKSIGITVLLLSLLRLAWRFVSPPPPLPASVTGWQRPVAHVTYILFYVIMLGLPLSGWALSSASMIIKVYPITLFHVVPWPTIDALAQLPPDQMKNAHRVFVTLHGLLGKLTYGLIVLHVGAALRHLILLRDGVVARMVPFLRAPPA